MKDVTTGSKNMVKVIVTATEHVVGVNFWDLCQVMLMSPPKTFEDLYQVIGRSNRKNPDGPRYIVLPKLKNKT